MSNPALITDPGYDTGGAGGRSGRAPNDQPFQNLWSRNAGGVVHGLREGGLREEWIAVSKQIEGNSESWALVNGERRTVPSGVTLMDLVLSLGLEPDRLAVELDREIVKRERWPATSVPSGAMLEIVQFVGGG